MVMADVDAITISCTNGTGETSTVSMAYEPWPVVGILVAAGIGLGALAGLAMNLARYRLLRSVRTTP